MIYFDNAATTKISDSVKEIMLKAIDDLYANPSAIYDAAIYVKMQLEKAREEIANTMGAKKREIFFTSGGSESDNWALRGIAEKYSKKGKHIITSKVEHKAILRTCEHLKSIGFEITYLDVEADGSISSEKLEEKMRDDTILVSIMLANNEVGTIMDVESLAKVAHSKGALFHTDAVQAYGHQLINCKQMGIDLLSASGHKFHGPKGVGFLYIRDGIAIEPLIYGGAQECGIRAGTENVIGILGMGQAAKEAYDSVVEDEKKISEMRDILIKRIKSKIPDSFLVGSEKRRSANNVCMCLKGINAVNLVDYLGEKDICISTGSACNSKSIHISHVLSAMGIHEDDARGTIRMSLSKYNEFKEINIFVDELQKAVAIMKQIY